MTVDLSKINFRRRRGPQPKFGAPTISQSVRFTHEEYEFVKAEAERRNYRVVSDYIRSRVIVRPRKKKEGDNGPIPPN